MVHFAVSNRQYGNIPTLRLCRELLKYEDSAKFLGLIFDRKLNWRIHLNKLNSECAKILRLMKMITSQKWGADQFCLLKVFRMYMRSKIDYGAIVYTSAKPNDLKMLNTTCNEALRIATGAFKSSPVESLLTNWNLKPAETTLPSDTLSKSDPPFQIQLILVLQAIMIFCSKTQTNPHRTAEG